MDPTTTSSEWSGKPRPNPAPPHPAAAQHVPAGREFENEPDAEDLRGGDSPGNPSQDDD